MKRPEPLARCRSCGAEYLFLVPTRCHLCGVPMLVLIKPEPKPTTRLLTIVQKGDSL
jgi:hypothetical protein